MSGEKEKNIRKQVEWYIEMISGEIETIERDCEEQRYAPIPALLYGQLKAYRSCKEMFEELLEMVEDDT